jgi:CubicO group peptidase (beta-lactamase class C family)
MEVRRVLDQALGRAVCSAVAAEVGDAQRCHWRFGAGRLALGETTPATETTVFDLASLTKVLATTTLVLALECEGRLDLATPVRSLVRSWSGGDRQSVTVRDLLEHASGLPAHRPYYLERSGRAAFEAAIATEPLEYEPRSRSVYSDLGFILLGFVLEDRGQRSLDRQFADWLARTTIQEDIRFGTRPDWLTRTAATEQDPWRGRLLRSDVHDENAAALNGVAGHAGLFGTAAAVGAIARWWLARLHGDDDPLTGIDAVRARTYAKPSTVPGSSRALGWDTMRPTSSCGSRWSSRALGHTGFTGTSLWIDPARDRYAVLLTNRVHPTRMSEGITAVRRDFHDAVVADFG